MAASGCPWLPQCTPGRLLRHAACDLTHPLARPKLSVQSSDRHGLETLSHLQKRVPEWPRCSARWPPPAQQPGWSSGWPQQCAPWQLRPGWPPSQGNASWGLCRPRRCFVTAAWSRAPRGSRPHSGRWLWSGGCQTAGRHGGGVTTGRQGLEGQNSCQGVRQAGSCDMS